MATAPVNQDFLPAKPQTYRLFLYFPTQARELARLFGPAKTDTIRIIERTRPKPALYITMQGHFSNTYIYMAFKPYFLISYE